MTPQERRAQESFRQAAALDAFIQSIQQQAAAAARDIARDLLLEDTARATVIRPQSIEKDSRFDARMQKKYDILMYRIGRYVQRTAKNSIKPRNRGRGKGAKSRNPEGIPSAPYTPPRIPLYRRSKSPLRELIEFSFDNGLLIIGPKIFKPSARLKVKPRNGQTIASVLEHGGRQVLDTKLGSKTLTYEPRPFMSLALLRAINSNTFQNLLSQVEHL